MMVKEGRFRADLYYRLNAITLRVPPLRERREDIARAGRRTSSSADAQRFGKRFRGVSATRRRTLLAAWPWPGNVRELKAVIQRAV